MFANLRKQVSVARLKLAFTLLATVSVIQSTTMRMSAQAAVSFVQVNSATPQSSPTTVTVRYTGAQTAGNLNVVVVGWNDDTTQVQSVVDSAGNTYQLAVGPTVRAGSATQSIYYAANIAAAAANANIVTVTFNAGASLPDIRIAEYQGAAGANPIDVTAAATGTGALSDSGSVPTTNANDLLVGANIVQKHTTAAGTSYTARVITSPDGDILEDRVVTAVGSYNASASTIPSSWYVMQMVAFRAASSDTQPPTAPGGPLLSVLSSSQISLTWSPATDNVGVTGYLIERCAGSGCSGFAQIGTSASPSFSDTGLAPSTSYSYRVRATDAAGNLGPYSPIANATTQPPPSISLVQVNSATPQSPTAVVTVPFAAPQGAGDLNVVVVGWNDANASVQSVADASGNVYSLAVGPTVVPGAASQSIYYAANIASAAANANVVTVTFTTAAINVDIRIAEYQGIATAGPVDVTSAAQGSGTLTDSGAVATTNPNDLMVGANMVQTHSTGAGAAYTSRVITIPDGDILEDRVVTSTGSYNATAPLSSAGWWIMQLVAFRGASSDTQAPSAPGTPVPTVVSSSQINLTWPPATDNVGVTGYLVERCAGAGCNTFAQVGTPSTTAFNDTGLSGSTTYTYRVRATDGASNLGPYSANVSATTPAPPDTQPPTAPSTPVPTVVSSTQINLTWAPATDNVGVTGYLLERCAGAGCSAFIQIGAPSTTSFVDTGLTASTTYSYRVRATDAANNLGPYSATASATTQSAPDTQPPTAPGTPVLTVASSSQINLTWPASTDNVAVTGYFIERCAGSGCSTFTQVGATPTTAFNDTGLAAVTSYSYRVRATDAASNLGPYSAIVSATTQPAAPISFVQLNSSTPQSTVNSVAVAFTAAQTAGNLNVVVVGWNDATATVQSVNDTNGNVYFLAVGPTVVAGSATQSIYYAPNIAAAAANGNIVTVSFAPSAAMPDIRIAEYSGIAANSPVDVTTAAQGVGTLGDSGAIVTTSANDLLVGANTVQTHATGPGTSYTQRVITSPDGDILEDRVVTSIGSYNATAPMVSGWWIMQMVAFRGGATADTTPPTAPGAPVLSVVSSSQINLTWPAATDDVGVTSYLVERCAGAGCSSFAQIGSSATTNFNNSGLAASTSYSYRIRATDAAGNLGPYSPTSSATTSAPSDTQPPTAPGTPILNVVSSTQINLTWQAATDNVGVAGYLLERCAGSGCSTFAQIATSATTVFSDTGLTASTTYSYRVRATDAANNLGPYSAVATATTQAPPDTQPPSAPGTPVPTVISSSQINLTWPAATDNVGVTGYFLERCSGSGCSAFVQIATPVTNSFNDTGLTASTTYSYRVRATDAANNIGPYSATAAATTTGVPNLTISKSHVGNFTQGQNGATYTLTVTNAGTAATTSAVTVTDTLPAGLTAAALAGTGWNCALVTLSCTRSDALGAAASYPSITLAVNVSATAPASVTNVAAVSGGGEGNTTDDTATDLTTISPSAGPSPPVFVTEAHFAVDQTTTGPNKITMSLNVSGTNTLLLAAMHVEFDGGDTNWIATDNGVTGTLLVNTNGYTGGAGNQRFRIYYWLNPPAGNNTVVIQNSYTGANELTGSTVLLSNVSQSTPLGAITLDVSTTGRTSESETVASTAGDLVVHVIADAVFIRGTLGTGETSVSIANDGLQKLNAGDGDASLWLSTKPGTSPTTTVSSSGWPSGPAPSPRVLNGVALVLHGAGSIVDTQPPTPPALLSATAISGTEIDLNWTASTDNVGVAAYFIERCQGSGCSTWSQIGSSGSSPTSFADTSVTANTAYSYRVRATDSAGNLSAYSNTATATTLGSDTQPPSAPGTLTATAVSANQVNLSWGAATDNIGVTGYIVQRCQGAACSNFATIGMPASTTFNDSGLTPSTAYTYLVMARDAANNVGPASNAASVMTPALNPNLIAAYAFSEGSGSTVFDGSGHGNTATISNATWTSAGKYGNALSFDGASSRVTVTDTPSFHLSNAMTLEAWVNPTALSSTWADLVYRGNDDYYLALFIGRPVAGITVGSGNNNTFGVSSLPLNTWTHVAQTFDGNTVTLYVNGVVVNATPVPGTIQDVSNPLEIGSDHIYGQYFQGVIDDVRIYNSVLTPAQIQSDMATPVGNP